MRVISAIAIAIIAALAATASARAEDGSDWLASLDDAWAPRLAAGEPRVVMAHVPLCDNRVLHCGNKIVGDGDHPDGNLYWNTDEGFLGWFGRRGSGWTPVAVAASTRTPADVLAVRVWHRRFAAAGAWKARGVKRAIDVYVVAWAWRGTAIDDTLAAYLDDVYGDGTRTIELDDAAHTVLSAGGASTIVAWVGHNRLMDVAPIDWAARAAHGSTRARGVIAEACQTAPYMAADVSSRERVPLLMTNDFLFAGATAFEGVVSSFARGESLAAMRTLATAQYALGEKLPVAHVARIFTNPAERHWPGPGKIAHAR